MNQHKTIAIGADHAGFEYKQFLLEQFQDSQVKDYGTYSADSVDYPDFAHPVAGAVEDGEKDFGILICGSGQGMCMAANRFKGIRASLCDSVVEAKASRNDDDANILCLPARTIQEGQAEQVTMTWLETAFAGAPRFKRRIAELDELG